MQIDMYDNIEYALLCSDLEISGYWSSINMTGNVFRRFSSIPLLISHCDFYNSKC